MQLLQPYDCPEDAASVDPLTFGSQHKEKFTSPTHKPNVRPLINVKEEITKLVFQKSDPPFTNQTQRIIDVSNIISMSVIIFALK